MGKNITAYYCGWTFPAGKIEKPYASVSIQYCDNMWEEIFRMPLPEDEGIGETSKKACARVVLEHYLGGPVSDAQIFSLVNLRGSSLCRLELSVLNSFRLGSLFP